MVLQNELRNVGDFDRLYGTRLGAQAFTARPVDKANDPLLTSAAGNYATHYDGAKLWLQMNWKENHTWGIVRKEPWGGPNQEDGWRVTTAFPAAKKNSDVGEDGALPDTKRPTRAFVVNRPKDTVYTFESSMRSSRAGNRNQGVRWESDKREAGIIHERGLAEDLAYGVGNSAVYLANGFLPIDKVVSNRAERVIATDYLGTAITDNDIDIYGIDRHTAASWADATVLANGAAVRPLTTNLIYQLLRTVAQNSGESYAGPTKVLLTGWSTWERIGLLEEGKQRFGETKVTMGQFNGLEAPPGRDLGFMATTFMGIPIIVSQDIDDQTLGVAPIYLIDSNYLMFWTDYPTLFHQWGPLEGGELTRGKLGEIGMFRTGGQMTCYKFSAQGKLRDIGA